MIEFDQVTKRYGSRAAVAELTLRIEPGEVFAFLGPNGAGKTTTVKMVVGLLRPTAGTIRVRGIDVVRDHRAASRLVGYVPDVPYLYDKLTGREFLEFLAEMRGLGADGRGRQVCRQIDELDLGDFIDELTETYSHGMKHRLALAGALLHEPSVLVLDEPMTGLDPLRIRQGKDRLRAQALLGTTVFLSTHHLALAEEIADRVGIVDHGRLKFVGTRADLAHELALDGSSLEQLYLSLTAPGGSVPSAEPRDGNPLAATEPRHEEAPP